MPIGFFERGFVPADEVLLFGQKDPKPFSLVRTPSGPFTSVPNHMAAELASLRQSSPNYQIRPNSSVAPKAKTKAFRISISIPFMEDGDDLLNI